MKLRYWRTNWASCAYNLAIPARKTTHSVRRHEERRNLCDSNWIWFWWIFIAKKDFFYFCEVFGFLENFGVKIDWNYFCLGEVVVMAKQVWLISTTAALLYVTFVRFVSWRFCFVIMFPMMHRLHPFNFNFPNFARDWHDSWSMKISFIFFA